MGCGKSAIGKSLSYALRQPFADTDEMIERSEKMTINEIFAKKGEEYFRAKETQVLAKLSEAGASYVVSTGGGLVLREENRKLMKELGITVYLRATTDTLYGRLKNDDKRPLLKNAQDTRALIEQMLEKRSPVYEEAADVIIDVDHIGIQDASYKIKGMIRKLQGENRDDKTGGRPMILVMHGPNLNFLGIREPEIYGRQTYDDLVAYIRKNAASLGYATSFFQSNHEGMLIDRIQRAYSDKTAGILINPGALTHYSYALHDALASVADIPKIEVHLSDITAREGFRAVSVTKDACQGQVYGMGFEGYVKALGLLDEIIKRRQEAN